MSTACKILVMGLPGTGKTTLARQLAARLGAVHWNSDAVREQCEAHGFTVENLNYEYRRTAKTPAGGRRQIGHEEA